VIYTGPLIDAHHHFWDVGMGKHAWLVPAPGQEMVFGDPTPLYRRARGSAAVWVKDERTCNLEAKRL
jgi:predicted TIM-barrel fold metal-dependent hydrolase